MEVYLNRIDGWDDAILTMFYSKRTITRKFENVVRKAVYESTTHDPTYGAVGTLKTSEYWEEVKSWLTTLFKWAPHHTTMGRFLDLSFTVYGMHRAGQDDWDAHAKRYNNRIIRSSTRLADFKGGEMSDYYRGKVVPTDVALAALGITTPDEIEYEGKTYVRAVNGYILKGMEDSKDVKRGLYMLCIPSNFIFKVDLTEFAHVYKERRQEGTAAPEVKQACEWMVDQLEAASRGFINRDLLMKIKN
jgi:hypothetical protein